VCIPLAMTGYLTPWLAGLGMSLSSLLVVGNALRLVRAGRPAHTPVMLAAEAA
jgi:Cu2+-exporting ATPase